VDVPINECLRAIGGLPEFLEGHFDFQLVKQAVEVDGAGALRSTRPRRFSTKSMFSPLETSFSPLKSLNFCRFPSENSGTDVQEWA
jgi:hypothetical protein